MLSHRMPRPAVALSFAVVLVCARLISASAQQPRETRSSPVVVRLGPAVVPLTGPWKFHVGDDPRWADPGYDDSAWETVDLTPTGQTDYLGGTSEFVPGWTRTGHPGHAGYAWYRLKMQVESSSAAVSLLMPSRVDDGYQVYANGREIGHFGDLTGNRPTTYLTTAEWFPMPVAALGRTTTIAIRFYMLPFTSIFNPDVGGMHGPPRVGPADIIAALGRLAQQQIFIRYLSYLLGFVVCFGFAAGLVAIYWLDRTETVYLWFVFAYLAFAAYQLFGFVAQAGLPATIPAYVLHPVQDVFTTGWPVLVIRAWWQWFELRDQRWLMRLVWIAAVIWWLAQMGMVPPFLGTLVPLGWFGGLHRISTAARLALGLLFTVMAVLGLSRQTRDSWLTVPAGLLFSISLFSQELLAMHVRVGWTTAGIRFNLRQAATVALSAVLGLLILRRFQRSQQRKQQLEADLHQAQQVQRVLLPQEIPAVPGFRIECEYRPAQEVGGDFFQVLETREGGVLVVIGDVSGKGVRAAMLVALIVGTLRTAAEQIEEPDLLLQRLNRRLVGRLEGGLVTCLCARLRRDGSLTVANAGHLAPWLDGQEIEVPHALPLGIEEGVSYTATHRHIAANSTLTFVSDGVVEAQNAHKELFGFERARALSTRPAAQIAEAARQFGQEDDITVITVQLSAVPSTVLQV